MNEIYGQVMLKQCVYVSHQTREFSIEDLRNLLQKSRENNNLHNITGLLLFDRPLFLQVLEGPPDSVEKIMKAIMADKRHRDIDIIYTNENLVEREFSHWSMELKILGGGLPAYEDLDRRIKRILSDSKPNGDHAHRLLLKFRKLKDHSFDND